MAWTISERFPSWGETGEFPAAGFFYEGGDQVNEKHLDALWNGVNGLEEDVQAALNDIDSDGDGTVDEADSALTYKGNDIDTNGDGVVDNAENITATYRNSDLDHEYINSDGSGKVANGNAGLMYSTAVANGDTVSIYHGSLTSEAAAAPEGTSLVLATLDGSGGGTLRATVIDGDGTLKAGTTKDPLASWENTTGNEQAVALLLDNGHFKTGSGSSQKLEGTAIGRIE